MLFYFLITVVFLAEVIIAAAILINLTKLDKAVCEWNSFVTDIKPQVSEILETFKKLSEQAMVLAPLLVNKLKDIVTKLVLDQLKGVLAGLTFWAVKKEVEKRVN
jgi:hypothetical protein